MTGVTGVTDATGATGVRRLRVGIIFGGRSVEHEVSLVSARSLLAAIDPARYEVVPIGVTQDGKWLTSSEVGRFLEEGVVRGTGEHTALLADPSVAGLVRLDGNGASRYAAALDVVFPLIHGAYGEDGKLQGLLEMADLPYVGSGVLGSALGMDKEVAKRLFRAAGLPIVEAIVVRACEWTEAGRSALRARLESGFGYPCFVKPACLGSSVGVSKASRWESALRAVEEAFSFDEKALLERALDAREIEVAVLGNDAPQASVPGEIVTSREFYDYEAKYQDTGTSLLIPAKLPGPLAERMRGLAIEAFRTLELAGMARVDFLLDKRTGEPYLNEVNTIPGFTPVSMYPKLWQASGVEYPELVNRLIDLAFERHRAKHVLRTSRVEAPAEDSHA